VLTIRKTGTVKNETGFNRTVAIKDRERDIEDKELIEQVIYCKS
jgi:hypothetical protein